MYDERDLYSRWMRKEIMTEMQKFEIQKSEVAAAKSEIEWTISKGTTALIAPSEQFSTWDEALVCYKNNSL